MARKQKAEKGEKKKSLMEILRSNASLSTAWELLTWEIPTFYSSNTMEKVRELASEEEPDFEQIQILTAEIQRQGQEVVDLMVEHGIIAPEDKERIHAKQEETGHPLAKVLMELRIVSPDAIADFSRQLRDELMDKEAGTRLEDALLKDGALNETGLAEAKNEARQKHIPLEQAIIQTGTLSFEALAQVMKTHFGIEGVDLSKRKPSSALAELIPDNLLRTGNLCPFKKEDNRVFLAMAAPRNRMILDKIKMVTGLDPVPFLALEEDIRKEQARLLDEGSVRNVVTQSHEVNLEKLVDSASTVRTVDNLIQGAVHARATDIHLEPQPDGLRVRYRVDGMLHDIMRIPANLMEAVVSRIKVMASMDVTERRRPQDGHVTLKDGQRVIDLRAATIPTRNGEKMVLRILDDISVMRGLAQLGLDPDNLDRMKRLVKRPHGMFLVTGPMGSGKTTTLYAALGEVNTPSTNIVTIEDPIEYQIPGITQVPVDIKADLTFAAGLRSILRQDANILMVGEIRDAETAHTAVRAALTGHLLFSTLHTNTAVGAIATLRHLGIPSYLIAGTLICVIAQRLVRTVCPECVEKTPPSGGERKALGLNEADSGVLLPRPRGCDRCLHTGYMGRTGIYEILENTDEISNVILEEQSENVLLSILERMGHRTLRQSAVQKVLTGETTLEELYRTVVI